MSQLPATKKGWPPNFCSNPPAAPVPDETGVRPVPPLTLTLNDANRPRELKNQLVGVGYQNESGRNCEPAGEMAARPLFSLTVSL